MTEALDRLALANGIVPQFVDANNTPRRTTSETKRALLRAMGIPATTEAEARECLAELTARRRLAGLPRTIVSNERRRIETRLSTEPAAPSRVTWRISAESGETWSGEALTTPRGRLRLRFKRALPFGEYFLMVEQTVAHGRTRSNGSKVFIAPPRCLAPNEVGGERTFGISCQIYGLRGCGASPAGTFADLGDLGVAAAKRGADFVGVNPIHALYPAHPSRCSPYSPSSRRYLDWRYIAIDRIPWADGADDRPVAGEKRDEASLDRIDWARVLPPKLRRLERLYSRLRSNMATAALRPIGRAFRRFVNAGGAALHRHCLFDALDEYFQRRIPACRTWLDWPTEFRTPESESVRRFARVRAERVEFFAFLQWLADSQLAEAQRRVRRAGMAIGLYSDLAIGVDPAGSSAWAEPETRISGATIGAPADYFNAAGQNWGLAPLSPTALSAAGCAAFVADVRAAMRHAGAMRIDHVMGLKRLYWIPDGAKPSQGAYVRYPFRELLGLICLESRRNRCIVIGEDLGTVPPGFRSTLARSSVLSTRVMFFERKSTGEYRSPRAYPRGAIASASTHDLPTIAGFWVERDLEWRARLGLLTTSLRQRHARRDRDDAKRALLTAMVREGLLPHGAAYDGAPFDDVLRLAIHRFLARSGAALMSIQIEDLAEELEQVNLPGTTSEHPNWRRRLGRSIGQIFDDPAVERILDGVRSERRNA